ncbi:MAG: monovalent cation/H+ antiporter subunit D family protein, partial [Pseudomonadales bacterium]|nr:monovalent cation/H+ antiporter subunit D family protein [Pseudomonadales bacterium]
MMQWSAETMLQLTILVPLGAAVAIVAAGRWPNVREGIALAAGALLFYLAVNLYTTFNTGSVVSVLWAEPIPGLTLGFQVEALGVLFALVAAFLWPVTTLYSIGYMRAHNESNQTRFYACFAISIASVMGIAFAANLLTLFIFY